MRSPSFRLFDLAAVLLLVFLLFVLTVPVGVEACASSRRMTNSTQLRGIHQGLVTYANSNKNWFAGLDRNGKYITLDKYKPLWNTSSYDPPQQAGITVEDRYALLIQEDMFTPEYAISPMENDSAIHPWPESGPVTADHYSFAMLQVPEKGGRHAEWKQSLNSQAIVMSDRNAGSGLDTYGIWNSHTTSSKTLGCSHNTKQPYINYKHWVGNVLWNDNHVELATTDSFETRYGPVENADDPLFRSAGEDDALLIHSGN